MPLGPGAKRLAAELLATGQAAARAPRIESAKVTAVAHPSQVAGKAAVCSVTWRGATFPATYPSDYTPVVNDVVFVIVQPPQSLTVFMKPKIA